MRQYWQPNLVIVCISLNRILLILAIGLTVALFSYSPRPPAYVSVIVPKGWPEPVYDFKANPITVDGYILGRKLFHDPLLSRDGTISCASCHSQYNGFTHVDHPVSHGIEDRKGTRNSPVLINLAWNNSFHWDGGVNNLEMQPLNPLQHVAEMDNTLEKVLAYLKKDQIYRGLFHNAFGDSLATSRNFLRALAQFNASLVSSRSKYDLYLQNRVEFTEQEKHGLKLFMKHCNSCHTAPLFNTNEVKSNGLPIDTAYNDLGRYGITQNGADSLKFRVPTLRNIAYTFPYMHDGRFDKLKEVLDHYADAIDQSNRYLSPELRKTMDLSENDRRDIIAFLLTLTDRDFLFNKDFEMPR